MSLDPSDAMDDVDTKSAPKTITLVGSDGKTVKIDLTCVTLSTLVAEAIEKDPDADTIPVPSVPSHVLARVVAYLNMRGGEPSTRAIPKPIGSTPLAELVDPIDAKFITEINKEVDQENTETKSGKKKAKRSSSQKGAFARIDGNDTKAEQHAKLSRYRQDAFADLACAANFMHIQCLLDLCCAQIAAITIANRPPTKTLAEIIGERKKAGKQHHLIKTEPKIETKTR